jgi:hypothetical protein
MIVGVLSSYLYPKYDVYIVPPGGNGSKANEFYPAELKNRRPADLPGVTEASVRDHEKSAYDVAGGTEFVKNDGFVLDSRPEL